MLKMNTLYWPYLAIFLLEGEKDPLPWKLGFAHDFRFAISIHGWLYLLTQPLRLMTLPGTFPRLCHYDFALPEFPLPKMCIQRWPWMQLQGGPDVLGFIC